MLGDKAPSNAACLSWPTFHNTRRSIAQWLNVCTVEWLLVPTVERGVAGNRSVSGAVIAT